MSINKEKISALLIFFEYLERQLSQNDLSHDRIELLFKIEEKRHEKD